MKNQVIVIGGGPAGLAASIYLARANLKPIVFAGDAPGGQLMLTSEIENFPGAKSLLGSDLVTIMTEQAKHFGASIIEANVTKVELADSPFKIHTESEEYGVVDSDTVLIATGAKALWLGLKSEERLRGKGVSVCATCDGFFFRNKIVTVIGGGDSALEEAIQLTKFAAKVYIIHRRDSFKASRVMQDRVLHDDKIEVIWNTKVLDITGQDKVNGLDLETQDGVKSHLDTDGVFVAIGHKPDTGLFVGQIATDSHGYIITSSTLANTPLRGSSYTNIPGVFAAGDCVDRIYRQASTASGMGVAAAIDIERYIQSQYLRV